MKKYQSERARDTSMMPSTNRDALNKIYSFEEWCEYHNVHLENTMRDDLIKKSAEKYADQFRKEEICKHEWEITTEFNNVNCERCKKCGKIC